LSETRRVRIESERTVHTYSEMWHTSNCLLEMAKEADEGAFHLLMGSMVFRAFSLEAYFNHVGEKLFIHWSDLETLSPKSKLNVIAERLELEVNYGERPWQVLRELFGFRNDIAHGKTITISESEEKSLERYHKNPTWKRAETDWEKYCTPRNAERARVEVGAIIKAIHDAAKIPDDYLFDFGMAVGGASLIGDS